MPFSSGSDAQYWFPEGDKYLTTTKYCRDINIKMSASRYAHICFYSKADKSFLYCQDSWKDLPEKEWAVIAQNVQDGQPFKIRFRYKVTFYGYLAY